MAYPVVQQGDSDSLWPLTDPGVTVSKDFGLGHTLANLGEWV